VVYTVDVTDRALREPTFLILTALAAGPQHGYGILRDVESISGGQVRLRAGTLYAALDRLASDGWVAVDREEVVDGRLRRYYQLTERGATRLGAELARLRAHTGVAERRLRARLGEG
jgi:DNA-binding PadR family transcriptional regulator